MTIAIGLFLGTSIGSYTPALFHADSFSIWGVFGTLIGGVAGIWLGYKIGNAYFEP